MDGFTKDLLFACMITKKPIKIRDHVTGKNHSGIIRGIESEPGHERQVVIRIDDSLIYHRLEEI